MHELWNWIVHDGGWLWIWVFWGTIASLFKGVRDYFIEGVRQLIGLRSEHEVRLLRERRKLASAEAELERARQQDGELPAPGPCVHRRVAAVIAEGEDVPSAWLCKSCDAQLPADWAVRKEDL